MSATDAAPPPEEPPMEIHKPKPIHNWREFLKEYAIIVLGVATALAAEQTVEYFHHDNQLRAARQELLAEAAENRRGLDGNRRELRAIEAELAQDMALLRHSQPPQAPLVGKLNYSWSGYRTRNGAWQAARQSGALDLMPHAELQNYAHLYAVLDASMDALMAQTVQMDHAAAIAARSQDGPVTPKDIEDMVAATTDAQGKAIFLKRMLDFEDQSLRAFQ